MTEPRWPLTIACVASAAVLSASTVGPSADSSSGEWIASVLSLVGIASAALLGAATWNRALQAQVEMRTREVSAVAERLGFHGLVQAQISDAIIVLNGERRVTMWNAAAAAMFQIPAAEVLGASADTALVPLAANVDVAAIRAQVEKTGVWRGEVRVRRGDGSELFVEATVQVLRRPDGTPDGRLVVVHDIDARKRAENELRAAAELHRATLDSTAEGIVSVDTEGRITSYNQRFLEIWDVPPEILATGSFVRIAEWKSQHVVDGARALAEFHRALTAEGVATAILRLTNGRVIERYSVAQRIDGRIVGRVWSYRDVTERARAEEERRTLELQIQQVQKLESLGVLAGGIAHDFNNLLVGMLGHAGLALSELPPDAPGRWRIQQIETCAVRAAELTNQMLAYSGKASVLVRSTDLNGLVEEMASLLQTAVRKNARLQLRLAARLPPVLADAVQLRQVVMNLITNASDALGEKGGTVWLSTGVMHVTRAYLAEACVGSSLDPGEYVYLQVVDEGSGMDADTRARIFEPFFTTKPTGRGLGLAAVLGIVRGHGGAVHLQSAPGRGTTFRIILPKCAEAAVVAPRAAKTLQASRHARILVVDDEPSVRTIACEALSRAGFDVSVAEHGAAAIEAFQEAGPAIDAVLLDMTMPGLSGVDTLRAIHNMVRGVPVVLTSGYSQQEAAARCNGEVIAGFIQKPFAPLALVATMNDVLAPGSQG